MLPIKWEKIPLIYHLKGMPSSSLLSLVTNAPEQTTQNFEV